MSVAEADLRDAAAELAEAERSRTPIPPLTDRYPDLTVDQAYAIQRVNVERRLAGGCQVRGHKVGLTATVMQEAFGVFEPDYGHLLDSMFVPESSTVPRAGYVSPRVEIESAFVLSKPLHGPGLTVADAITAVYCVLPAIEIIDSRIQDWRIRIADTVADNGSSAGVILGGRPTSLNSVDLRDVHAVMEIDGRVVQEGNTSAVLGNPLTALVWLANTLGKRGIGFDAGHVVLPGACVKALPVHQGAHVRGRFVGLGPVEVAFS